MRDRYLYEVRFPLNESGALSGWGGYVGRWMEGMADGGDQSIGWWRG